MIKKVKCDRLTDPPTNQPTDRTMDKAGCRVACTRLKTCAQAEIFRTGGSGLDRIFSVRTKAYHSLEAGFVTDPLERDFNVL